MTLAGSTNTGLISTPGVVKMDLIYLTISKAIADHLTLVNVHFKAIEGSGAVPTRRFTQELGTP